MKDNFKQILILSIILIILGIIMIFFSHKINKLSNEVNCFEFCKERNMIHVGWFEDRSVCECNDESVYFFECIKNGGSEKEQEGKE